MILSLFCYFFFRGSLKVLLHPFVKSHITVSADHFMVFRIHCIPHILGGKSDLLEIITDILAYLSAKDDLFERFVYRFIGIECFELCIVY